MSIASVEIIDHPTLTAESAMSATEEPAFTFLPLGAILQKFELNGLNIVQGFNNVEEYKQHNAPYFGETIGRVANRIAGAKIDRLNGRSYSLDANDGRNSLHGGVSGWGKHVFDGPTSVERSKRPSIQFKYISPNGDEGFPGTVETRVFYTASTTEQDGRQVASLEIEYEAELIGDDGVQETVVAMTNHSYFNLSGLPTIEGTEVTLPTTLHQEVDDASIPTGQLKPYPGIEPNKTFTLGAQSPGFNHSSILDGASNGAMIDHCFIVNDDPNSVPIDTRSLPIKKLASFYHPTTGVHLEAHSTEPAFQFYTGEYINVPAVGDQPARGPRSGFCVEASRYVNAINHEEWRNMVVLKRGQTYGSRTIYRAWRDQ